jgi:hypothetical protein
MGFGMGHRAVEHSLFLSPSFLVRRRAKRRFRFHSPPLRPIRPCLSRSRRCGAQQLGRERARVSGGGEFFSHRMKFDPRIEEGDGLRAGRSHLSDAAKTVGDDDRAPADEHASAPKEHAQVLNPSPRHGVLEQTEEEDQQGINLEVRDV